MLILIAIVAAIAVGSAAWWLRRRQHAAPAPPPKSMVARASSEDIEITLTADLLAGRLAPEHYRTALARLAAGDGPGTESADAPLLP